MINVFISRPTWIAEEYKIGLNGFLSFLDTHDLKPRTIGSTDYPTESPLDEVISLIEECKGVIILGYPQIHVIKGKIKEAEKSDFILPTEWNHIEATLAYMNKLPMLIIHHTGISRGIFEHGTMSKFIYEKDLTEANWFLTDNIKGALKKWKLSIESHKIPVPKPEPMPKLKSLSSQERLDTDTESVLTFLFSKPSEICRDDIRKFLDSNEQVAEYYIDVLTKHKMIEFNYITWDNIHYFSLTAEGREYVMTNKLFSTS